MRPTFWLAVALGLVALAAIVVLLWYVFILWRSH
jgi:hypothetical protein